MNPRKFLTRRVIKIDSHGDILEYGVSVVSISEEGIAIEPFTQESEGVLYIDTPIHILEDINGVRIISDS